jgi:hypothetical protein
MGYRTGGGDVGVLCGGVEGNPVRTLGSEHLSS